MDKGTRSPMDLKHFILALTLALSVTAAAHAQQLVLKIQPDASTESPEWTTLLTPWMKRLESQSNGRIRFDVSQPSQGTAGQSSTYQRLGQDAVDVIWSPVLGGQPADDKKADQPGLRTEVFELPFMMTNPEAVSRALWEYVEAFAADEFKDVHLIALHVQGPGAIHTSSRPVRSLEDIKSLRLSSEPRRVRQLLNAIDNKQQEVDSASISEQLSSAVVDGVVADWQKAQPLAANKLARHHTEFDAETGALFTKTYVLAMDLKKYESLSEDLKKIIDANSGIETSAELGRLAQEVAETERSAVAELSGKDAVITMPLADAQAFRKASIKVDQAWVAEITSKGYDGQKLLDGAKTLIKKHTK